MSRHSGMGMLISSNLRIYYFNHYFVCLLTKQFHDELINRTRILFIKKIKKLNEDDDRLYILKQLYNRLGKMSHLHFRHGRKFTPRLSKEDVYEMTQNKLSECGVDQISQASFTSLLSQEVVGNKDFLFTSLQPRLKLKKDPAWRAAYTIVLNYLNSYQMSITLNTMNIEKVKDDKFPSNSKILNFAPEEGNVLSLMSELVGHQLNGTKKTFRQSVLTFSQREKLDLNERIPFQRSNKSPSSKQTLKNIQSSTSQKSPPKKQTNVQHEKPKYIETTSPKSEIQSFRSKQSNSNNFESNDYSDHEDQSNMITNLSNMPSTYSKISTNQRNFQQIASNPPNFNQSPSQTNNRQNDFFNTNRNQIQSNSFEQSNDIENLDHESNSNGENSIQSVQDDVDNVSDQNNNEDEQTYSFNENDFHDSVHEEEEDIIYDDIFENFDNQLKQESIHHVSNDEGRMTYSNENNSFRNQANVSTHETENDDVDPVEFDDIDPDEFDDIDLGT